MFGFKAYQDFRVLFNNLIRSLISSVEAFCNFCVPKDSIQIDADADADNKADSLDSCAAKEAINAPAKTSPAPVGSTTLVTGKAPISI